MKKICNGKKFKALINGLKMNCTISSKLEVSNGSVLSTCIPNPEYKNVSMQ
jgi:hypothetical protein